MALNCVKINDNYKKRVSKMTHKKEQEKMELNTFTGLETKQEKQIAELKEQILTY